MCCFEGRDCGRGGIKARSHNAQHRDDCSQLPFTYSEGYGRESTIVVQGVEENSAGISQTRLWLPVVQIERSLSHQRQMHIRGYQQVILRGGDS